MVRTLGFFLCFLLPQNTPSELPPRVAKNHDLSSARVCHGPSVELPCRSAFHRRDGPVRAWNSGADGFSMGPNVFLSSGVEPSFVTGRTNLLMLVEHGPTIFCHSPLCKANRTVQMTSSRCPAWCNDSPRSLLHVQRTFTS